MFANAGSAVPKTAVFDLQRAMRDSGVAASAGCVACLRAGRFGFPHITEIGYLEEGGITRYGDDEPEEPARVFAVDSAGSAAPIPAPAGASARVAVSPEAVDELGRTPDFSTWNEVAWPVHCSDFMVYLGTWEPTDVRAAAEEKQQEPRDLFVEMTDTVYDRLWPDDAQQWSFAFHVFRCESCSTLRGAVDAD